MLKQWSERLVSRWDRVNGFKMHARVSTVRVPRERLPIILVHGLAVASRYLIPTAFELAPDHHVYAPDLPGFGESEKPRHILNTAELADTLAAWMTHLRVDRAVLLGNSYGCQLIAEFAMRHPERLSHAILVGPTVDRMRRNYFQQVTRLLLDAGREPLEVDVIQFLDYAKAGMRRTIRMSQYSLQDRIEEKLENMRLPTLIVRGARDPIVPQDWAEEAARLLPNGRLVVVPGAAHVVNYTHAPELARATRIFLQEQC